jgi:RND family efflux transporter MFP subunit
MNRPHDLLSELRIERGTAPPPNRRGLWIGIGVAAVVLLLVAIGGWALMRDKALPVHTATVTAIGGSGGGSTSVLDATGYVTARRMATVSAKITGKVRDIRIEEGQHVEAGQIMATLDPIDADAQRQLAASQLAAARSQVGNVRAQLKQAEADAARYQQLASRKLVARSQFEQFVAQRDALRAQLEVAQHNVEVASDQARIADNGVNDTVVRAPFAGVIIDKAAQPGEIVSPFSAGGGFTRTGIGTIVDMDSLEVEVEVGEAFIGRVQPKMPVEATLNAYPDWKIPGDVIAIIPTADRSKATVKVRVALNVHDPRIVPDMGVRVSFLEKKQPADASAPKPGVLAPASAIVSHDGVDSAFVIEDDKAMRRTVKLGRTLGDDREVLAGLAAGDNVVLNPPNNLVDGMRVVVEKSADNAATPNP